MRGVCVRRRCVGAARSRCVLWCLWPFCARGEANASKSLSGGTPTLRVDTLPPARSLLPLFHQLFRE